MATRSKEDPVAQAIHGTLCSPNESDRNLEAANVVDGLFAIARALNGIAKAIEAHTECVPSSSIAWDGLERVSNAIDGHAESVDRIGRELLTIANVLENNGGE